MKAPFPYFGGKSTVAGMVWQRFGDAPNYVEPFFGSGAILLSRPDTHERRSETVNDLDGLLANFWRAVQSDPDTVAKWADWPVNENDLHARHAWLVGQKESLRAKLEGDPDYYDAKIAGWWVWGISAWIGGGWCSGKGPWQQVDGQLIHVGDRGINRKRIHVGDRGINRQLIHVGGRGTGVHRPNIDLLGMMRQLSDRLRRVRVACGDWTRIMGTSPTIHQGLTAVFLDPPYSFAERDNGLYTTESDVSGDVRQWALEHGDDPLLRIALCGYDGEHEMPASWDCVKWKAQGGYGGQGSGRGKENMHRERIWFSRHCLPPLQQRLL